MCHFCRPHSVMQIQVLQKLLQTTYYLLRICHMKRLVWCCKSSSNNILDSGKSGWLKQSRVLLLLSLKTMFNPPWRCRLFKALKLTPNIPWLSLLQRSNSSFVLLLSFWNVQQVYVNVTAHKWVVSFYVKFRYSSPPSNAIKEKEIRKHREVAHWFGRGGYHTKGLDEFCRLC